MLTTVLLQTLKNELKKNPFVHRETGHMRKHKLRWVLGQVFPPKKRQRWGLGFDNAGSHICDLEQVLSVRPRRCSLCEAGYTRQDPRRGLTGAKERETL
jgi:hypothetical protein